MRWRFKSPASWLFTQPFIQINENIKAPRRWPPVTGEFLPQMASNAENVSIWWRFLMTMCYPQSAIKAIAVLCLLAVRGRWYTDIYICATLKFWQLHDLNKPHFEGSWHQYSRCKLMCVSNMTKPSIYVRMVYLNGIYTNDLLVWGDGCYWDPFGDTTWCINEISVNWNLLYLWSDRQNDFVMQMPSTTMKLSLTVLLCVALTFHKP